MEIVNYLCCSEDITVRAGQGSMIVIGRRAANPKADKVAIEVRCDGVASLPLIQRDGTRETSMGARSMK